MEYSPVCDLWLLFIACAGRNSYLIFNSTMFECKISVRNINNWLTMQVKQCFKNVFLPYVCFAFVSVCLYVPCGHLLGKGLSLGSRLWCPTVSVSLSHWYPGSGVVLDCIES